MFTKRPEAGFSLVEVVVAFVITGLVLVAALRLFGGAFDGSARAERLTLALVAAESTLESFGTALPLRPGTHRGDAGPGMSWRAEVERYRAEVMATTGAKLDDAGKALLEEDLSTPCTEEIAIFQAFARTVDKASDRIVVLDTAPTGHTILLLDAAQAFHKEVSRQAKSVPDAVLKLLPRLRDPAFTRVILCTLAEATPVHEAAQLQSDLRRAGIEPFAWVITQSLAAVAVTDPILVARRAQEQGYIEEVVTQHAKRTALVPWRMHPLKADAAILPTGTG